MKIITEYFLEVGKLAKNAEHRMNARKSIISSRFFHYSMDLVLRKDRNMIFELL